MSRRIFFAFSQELAKQDAALAQAFLEAVADLRSASQKRLIIEAIESGNIRNVFEALRLGPDFFAPLDRQIGEAFRSGAIWQIGQLPKKIGPEGTNLVVRFNQRNPRAEDWIRLRAGSLITELVSDMQVAASDTVAAGLAEGRGAKAIANDLVGQLVGNQRQGGVVGLHSRDAAAVRAARAELSDPTTMRGYLQRQNAPHRGIVRTALRADKPLTETQINRIVRFYSDKLLHDRGERIGRTEAHAALMAGQFEALEQMIDSGQVPREAVRLEWRATVASPRTRDSHRGMNAQKVPFGRPFTSPTTGALMLHPGDGSLGAPASELINCRCGMLPQIDRTQLAT